MAITLTLANNIQEGEENPWLKEGIQADDDELAEECGLMTPRVMSDFDKMIEEEEEFLNDGLDIVEELEAVFVVYPNPTNSFINVKGLKNDADYSLIDIKGKPVQEGIISFANPSIDIRNLNNGFYFMQLNGEVYKVNKGN